MSIGIYEMDTQEVKVSKSEQPPIVQTLLNVEEVAKILRVSPSWVYEHTRERTKDRIPGIRLGKYWRFVEADVVAWLAARQDK